MAREEREVDQLVDATHDRTPGSPDKTDDRYEALVFMDAWLGPRRNEARRLPGCDVNRLRQEMTFGKVVDPPERPLVTYSSVRIAVERVEPGWGSRARQVASRIESQVVGS